MFRESTDVEYYLKSRGVKFEFIDGIGFDELSRDWDAVNYGRDKTKVVEAILDYAERAEGGSMAPAVILHLKSEGYEVLDGVQRLCSIDMLGITKFSAYVIKTKNDSTLHMIRIGSNSSLNGVASVPSEFVLQNAVEILHIQDKLSARDIGNAIGRTKKAVQKEIVRQVSCNRLSDAGYKGAIKKGWIDHASINLLKTDWEKNANCIVTAFEFLESASGKNGLAKELFEQLGETKPKKNCKREVQFASVIDKFAKRPEIANQLAGKRRKDRFDVAIEQLRGLKTVLSEISRSGHTTDHDGWIADMAELVRGCKYELRRICPGEKGMFAA